jgi:hypothetical protein
MCPDRKLEWFNKNPDWIEDDRKEARRILEERWESVYGKDPSQASRPQQSVSNIPARVSTTVTNYSFH